MQHSHFIAYLFRLKLIKRWSLMRNVRDENVCEHSLQVAFIAHLLALIENQYYGGCHDVAHLVLLAIYHDISEILTGDLSTPIKYHNPKMAKEYKKIEKLSQQKLLALLPKEFQDNFLALLDSDQCTTKAHLLIKQADILCAYIKCLEELMAGNNDFRVVKRDLLDKITQYRTPTTDHFMRCFIPSFELCLDQMDALTAN